MRDPPRKCSRCFGRETSYCVEEVDAGACAGPQEADGHVEPARAVRAEESVQPAAHATNLHHTTHMPTYHIHAYTPYTCLHHTHVPIKYTHIHTGVWCTRKF